MASRKGALRRAIPLLVGLAVVGAVLWWWKPWAPDAGPAATYKTAEVDRGPIQAKVTATGTLSPRVTVQIGSQVGGRIATVLVDYNDKVTKGQVLATIDPSSINAQLDQARASRAAASANLKKAQAQLAEAQRKLARATLLSEQKLIAAADIDAAQATVDTSNADVAVQRAQVAQVDSSIKQLNINLGYTTITSSVDGSVISRAAEVGQTVSAGLQVTTLFTIAQDLGKMQIDTSVSEGDIGRLADGQRTEFTVDAFAGKTFEGVVRQIRNEPTTVSNVVTYNAVIDVENSGELRPGMTANVTFIVAEIAEATRVPNSALRFQPTPAQFQALGLTFGGRGGSGSGSGARGSGARPPGGGGGGGGAGRGPGGGKGGKMLWKRTADGMEPVRVTLGLTDGTYTEVTGGDLAPGTELVTELIGVAKSAPRKMGAF